MLNGLESGLMLDDSSGAPDPGSDAMERRTGGHRRCHNEQRHAPAVQKEAFLRAQQRRLEVTAGPLASGPLLPASPDQASQGFEWSVGRIAQVRSGQARNQRADGRLHPMCSADGTRAGSWHAPGVENEECLDATTALRPHMGSGQNLSESRAQRRKSLLLFATTRVGAI